jgi:hypothetical protein
MKSEFFSFGLGYYFGIRLKELEKRNPIKFYAYREIMNKYLGRSI